MGIGRRITETESQGQAVGADATLTQPLFTLADLILPEKTAAGIADFLAYRKHEHLLFNQWGLAHTHRHQRQTAVNFYGPPGTGKTMAAQAIAHELKQPLIMVDYAELESKYVGETSKNIAKIFEQAKNNKAIIFFDEADAILSRRVTDMSNATDVSVNQTRSVLLTLMNQHEELIIFTTNFIENYDPAFMRRILAHIHFDLPDLVGRQKLWTKYIPATFPHDSDFAQLAEASAGLSGSDISSSVLKAAMSAARQGCTQVSINHFLNAIDEIVKSKAANSKNGTEQHPAKIEQRVVSENYVRSQLGSQTVEALKV